MKQVHKFKYLGCMVNNKGTVVVVVCEKLMNGRRVAETIKRLVNENCPSLEYTRVVHKNLLIL